MNRDRHVPVDLALEVRADQHFQTVRRRRALRVLIAADVDPRDGVRCVDRGLGHVHADDHADDHGRVRDHDGENGTCG